MAECPVNLECRVIQQVWLPSHSLFIAEVVAPHAEKSVLNERDEVDLARAKGGLTYGAAVVREGPVEKFRPSTRLQIVRIARQQKQDASSGNK